MTFQKLTFTERLIRLRAAKGLTQRDMASILGCSGPYLNDIEHGRRGPTVNFVHAVADVFEFGPYLRKVWHLSAARAHGWEV